jgi:nucleotide-binding universal stress UspA family protein
MRLPMSANIIVSYDGTPNDDDALALARMLAAGGATLALAYVRHTREYDAQREEVGEYDAKRRLETGSLWLEDPDIKRHVVVDPSTSRGLASLAASEGADLIVFGSDYRTPPGRVEPGGTAQGLLEGGKVAIGVAQAGLRTRGGGSIATISVAGNANGSAHESAESLAGALGAELISGRGDADLILVDSQAGAPEGRIALGGAARNQLDSARGSVIVLPRGASLRF